MNLEGNDISIKKDGELIPTTEISARIIYIPLDGKAIYGIFHFNDYIAAIQDGKVKNIINGYSCEITKDVRAGIELGFIRGASYALRRLRELGVRLTPADITIAQEVANNSGKLSAETTISLWTSAPTARTPSMPLSVRS